MSEITERNKVVNTQNKPNQAGILKNAMKMAFGTMTSRVLGLVRESLLAALFDKSVTDAWGAAFRLPNMFRRLLGEGSLSVSFIPIFVEARHDNDVRAQNLVNSLYTLLLFILAIITTIGVLKPDWLLDIVLDSSYIQNTEKYLMTRRMAQIMFAFVFFISSFAFFMGILNALGQFFWPAIAPTFWNLTMVISTLWPKSWMSEEAHKYGDQLAWGVLIGGALQALVLVPSLKKSGYFPRISFQWNNSDLKMVFKNMVPGLIGMGLLQFTTIINLKFASSLPEGTISYINYVDRLIELPLSLIAVSLGTALLPVLSSLWVQDKKDEMSRRARYYLQLNLFVSITAACGLYVLAEPIISVLYGRGRFGANDVLQAALILKTYCWIMVFASGVRVLTPTYYAVKNTWFPALVSGLSLFIHVMIAPVLMNRYGIQGLMASTIISAGLNLLSLLVLYRFLVFKFEYFEFIKNCMVYSVFGGFVIVIANLHFIFVGHMPLPAALVLTMALVAIAFMIMASRLFPSEFARIINRVRRRS